MSSIKVVASRSSLFCFFAIISILFILSWFFVLRSTGRVNPMRLPNYDLNTVSQIQNVVSSFSTKKCSTNDKQVLKVFMYDLPPEFHFGLLNWKPKSSKSVWPDIRTKIPEYPGGLNLQHSIEYWLTLDLLASELPKPSHVGAAIRVHNSSEADIIFVPFFSSLSYNRFAKSNIPNEKKKNMNKVLQEKLVKHLVAQEEWKKSGGRDHLIMAHHPNSMLDARMQLWPATFILADFGRYPPNVANVQKDVIAPYKHLVESYVNDFSDFDSRPILLYFQGAIYRKDVCKMFVLLHLFYFQTEYKQLNAISTCSKFLVQKKKKEKLCRVIWYKEGTQVP